MNLGANGGGINSGAAWNIVLGSVVTDNSTMSDTDQVGSWLRRRQQRRWLAIAVVATAATVATTGTATGATETAAPGATAAKRWRQQRSDGDSSDGRNNDGNNSDNSSGGGYNSSYKYRQWLAEAATAAAATTKID